MIKDKDKNSIQRQSQAAGYFSIMIGLLRDRQGFLEEIRSGVRLQSKIIALLVSSSIFFALYGAIIGSSHSFPQALSAAIKLPAFYLITLLICFPTLYFFNILFGSRSSIEQHFVVLLTAVSVISVLLFSLAAVTLVFVITAHKYYQFFKVLNVAIFALTGVFGIKFLYEGMQLLSEQDPVGKETRRNILRCWLVLYAFVGCQLGWFLRPFFGSPSSPFELFRKVPGNFYLDIVTAFREILGFR